MVMQPYPEWGNLRSAETCRWQIGDRFEVCPTLQALIRAETPELARDNKGESYLRLLGKPEALQTGWHFMTADQQKILTGLTDALGFWSSSGVMRRPGVPAWDQPFMFRQSEWEMITRYLYGIEYTELSFAFKRALFLTQQKAKRLGHYTGKGE